MRAVFIVGGQTSYILAATIKIGLIVKLHVKRIRG